MNRKSRVDRIEKQNEDKALPEPEPKDESQAEKPVDVGDEEVSFSHVTNLFNIGGKLFHKNFFLTLAQANTDALYRIEKGEEGVLNFCEVQGGVLMVGGVSFAVIRGGVQVKKAGEEE